MKRAIKMILGFAMVAVGLTGMSAVSSVTPAMEHVRELKVRPDGSYDVTCIDGEMEVRTAQEIQAGRACTHIVRRSGVWNLMEGGIEDGMRMCDMNLDLLTGKNKVLSVAAGFAAPCGGEVVKTEDCNGLVCNVNLGETFYTMDFSTSGRMVLTRLRDGFRAVFRGANGIGETQARVRLQTLQGVPNILQATNDNGATWLSVCDDDFTQENAAVACRELGYAGVQNYDIGIEVPRDDVYGLDDIDCVGDEESLLDCRHNPWGAENCSSFEHVQLTCN